MGVVLNAVLLRLQQETGVSQPDSAARAFVQQHPGLSEAVLAGGLGGALLREEGRKELLCLSPCVLDALLALCRERETFAEAARLLCPDSPDACAVLNAYTVKPQFFHLLCSQPRLARLAATYGLPAGPNTCTARALVVHAVAWGKGDRALEQHLDLKGDPEIDLWLDALERGADVKWLRKFRLGRGWEVTAAQAEELGDALTGLTDTPLDDLLEEFVPDSPSPLAAAAREAARRRREVLQFQESPDAIRAAATAAREVLEGLAAHLVELLRLRPDDRWAPLEQVLAQLRASQPAEAVTTLLRLRGQRPHLEVALPPSWAAYELRIDALWAADYLHQSPRQ